MSARSTASDAVMRELVAMYQAGVTTLAANMLAERLWPNGRRKNANGQVFHLGAAVAARLLRRCPAVREREPRRWEILPHRIQPPQSGSDHGPTAIAPLLWVLWHHQGARSPVGQAIRRYLGLAQFERLTPAHLALAAQFQELPPVEAADSAPPAAQPPAPAPEIPEDVRSAFAELERKQENLSNFRSLRESLAVDQPPTPALASDGEREELAQWIEKLGDDYDDLYPPKESIQLYRAASLLRTPAPAPAAVPAELLPTRYLHPSGGTIERTRTDPDAWAVRRGSERMSVLGEWSIEPSPSERTADYLAEHSFSSPQAALAVLQQQKPPQGGEMQS